jgi:hypothetical protein
MTELRVVIKESTDLLKSGRHSEALAILDGFIAQAKSENRPEWVRVASGRAWAIATSMDDRELARSYKKQRLTVVPEDPFALYALAELLFEENQTDSAKQCAAKSYQLISHSPHPDDQYLLKSLVQKWPEVSGW